MQHYARHGRTATALHLMRADEQGKRRAAPTIAKWRSGAGASARTSGQAPCGATSLMRESWFPSGSLNSANHNSDLGVRLTT